MSGGGTIAETLRRAKRVAGRLVRKHVIGRSHSTRPADESVLPSTEPLAVASDPDALFTVILPTLDRAATLADTIRTCLAQQDRDLLILVSDNASTDHTADIVASFSDSRLNYINSGRRLGMAEHWEFSLRHVDSGYVTVVGEDDGLLPGAINSVRQLIAASNSMAVAWQTIEYGWPDHPVTELRNRLRIPLSIGAVNVKPKDVVKQFTQHRADCSPLPRITNSFLSMDLIKAYREKNGGVLFAGTDPDLHSAVAVASEVDEFVYCMRPLSIKGAGSKGNDTPQPSDARKDMPAAGGHVDADVFEATMVGVEDIYKASVRADEILRLYGDQRDLFERLAATRRPEIAIALFACARGAPLRLHLGCGSAYFDGYVNVDFPASEHAIMTVNPDVMCDLTEIDLPEGSVEEIRLHHVFEHLNRAVALASMIRWQRWLRIGGKLLIETPDFEASARDFLSANGLQAKMRAIRHLEGDQVGGWAYHVGQWFPERFEHTFKQLGFGQTEIRRETSIHEPPLHNVTAIGTKTSSKTALEQFQAGCELLRDSMVAEAEGPTWEAWKNQLAGILAAEMVPKPTIFHPPS